MTFAIRTSVGFEDLCKAKDVAIGVVFVHAMADNMKVALVTETIEKAKRRWILPEGYIYYSDFGSQYTVTATQ